MKRKVSFYLLTVNKDSDEKNVPVKEAFEYIYNNKLKNITDNSKATELRGATTTYVAQIIDMDTDLVFIKIGRQHPSNTIALRDIDTLETDNVVMRQRQKLEVYTICLLDLSTGILSYIGMSGAPRATVVRELFLQYDKDGEKPVVRLAAIITPDVLKKISNKGIISSIEYTVAVPPDQILNEKLGVSEKDFDNLRNVKTSTTVYNIKASKGKSLFSKPGKFEQAVRNIMGRTGDDLIKIVIGAKNPEESVQHFDLMENAFTKSFVINQTDLDNISENELIKLLRNIYAECKEEAMAYIRQ